MPYGKMASMTTPLGKEAHSPLYTTRAQIAARYSISPRHLDSLIKDGIIPSIRLGKRCIRIPVSQADAYLKSLQIGGNKV